MKIRKLIMTAAALAATATMAMWGKSAGEYFGAAPSTVIPILDTNTRLDMLDYYDCGSRTASTNVFDGKSRVTYRDSLTVRYELTERNKGQLSVIPMPKGDSLIIVITTLATPTPDSEIEIYTTRWQRPGKPVFSAPTMSDWITAAAPPEEQAQVMMYSADYDSSTKTLTLTSTMDKYCGTEPHWLRRQLIYRFDGKKFKQEK